MAYFDGIKVGDKVYTIDGTELDIDDVNNKLPYKNFMVCQKMYDFSGQRTNNEELGQVLFWQPPPKFDPPPRPKCWCKALPWGSLPYARSELRTVLSANLNFCPECGYKLEE